MDVRVSRVSPCLVAFVLLTVLASAEGVRIVTPAGDLTFADLQPAVDAAAEGDVLLVAEGSYSAFTIDGKSLSIHALPGAAVSIAAGSNAVTIRNLGAQQRVLLVGIQASGGPLFSGSVLLVQDCEGYVRLQGCSFLGGGAWYSFDCQPWHGGSGARVVDSDRVAMIDVELRGQEGWWQDAVNIGCDAGDGGAALTSVRSRIALHGCELTGGGGGKAKGYPGDGGTGLHATESELYASGDFVLGGTGGASYTGGFLVDGGDGVWLDADSLLDAVDLAVTGGNGTPPGQAVAGPGSYNRLPTSARSLGVATIVAAGAPASADYVGEALDVVWLAAASQPGHVWQTGAWGVWLTKFPSFVPFAPLGTATAGGTATLQLPIGPTAPGATHRELVFQGLAAATWGHRFLSDARHVLVLSPTVGPDCNGNGVSDFLDVLLGTSPDANHNLIPDECPGG